MRVLFAFIFILIGGGVVAQPKTFQPGDSISITVLQDPKLDRQMLIGPNGMISFPMVGEISAQGKTPAQLESSIRARLRDKFTEAVDVNVTWLGLGLESTETRPRIYVTGEVRAPGAYPIHVQTDIVQAIALAGGLGQFAAKHRIQVRRKIHGIDELIPFDYVAYETGQVVGENLNLRPGDIVIVPERGLFE
jgi:polysaccharide export outer membrane protein